MNILVLFTGGTIACSRSDGALSPDADNSYALLQRFDSADVRFTTASPYFVLSENLGTAHLRRLYDCLTGYDLSCFDGVIIAHGTDTLAYTAAYLSLRLGLCDTPVVLVSAAYPLSDSRTNGFDNMRGAIDFIASRQGKGVFVSYKNDGEPVRIHRGTMVLPHAPYDDSVRNFSWSVSLRPTLTYEFSEHLSAELSLDFLSVGYIVDKEYRDADRPGHYHMVDGEKVQDVLTTSTMYAGLNTLMETLRWESPMLRLGFNWTF